MVFLLVYKYSFSQPCFVIFNIDVLDILLKFIANILLFDYTVNGD